ncbi:Snurportin-1 [Thelohanellus kitauei]|uniref:Snurportin-1 n=1 Tax=Thelohanellus kitauei TaxID=669202 RepID=A0A0C2ML95_THEKT|nr:Snurportin-1 [Thelohanellus kitauei]
METPVSQRLYEKYFKFSSDQTRLEKALDEQKIKREKMIEKLRASCEESQSTSESNVSIHPDELMIPETSRSLPLDFDSWVVVVRPKGVRYLVLSHHGSTKLYDEEGKHVKTLRTCLPGGGVFRRGGPCIIDCVYSELSNTFYIVDILSWNKQTFVGCASEERFLFVSFKISDILCDHQITSICKRKNFPLFSDLARFKISSPVQVKELVDSLNFQIEGYYIYHMRGMYFVNESSPLFLYVTKDDFESHFSVPPKVFETPLIENQTPGLVPMDID